MLQEGLRQCPRASGKLTSSARWMPQSFRSSTAARLLRSWAGADRELCRAPFLDKWRGESPPLCWFRVPVCAATSHTLLEASPSHPLHGLACFQGHGNPWTDLRPMQPWALHALPYMWMQCDEQATSLIPQTAQAHSPEQRRSPCSGHCDLECLSTAWPACQREQGTSCGALEMKAAGKALRDNFR